MMDRRELLKMIAVITGAAVAGGEFFLSGCQSAPATIEGFSEKNIALLDEVAETILPATHTPGAKAAKVGAFMQVFVTDCYTKEEKENFLQGMAALQKKCVDQNGKAFMECTSAQRHQFLLGLEEDARQHRAKPENNTAAPGDKQLPHYYTMIKQLTLLGFFTSRVGAEQALRYERVPHRYDGDISYKKGDRAWAD